MSWITGVDLTPFGCLAGRGTLDLMSGAAADVLADAGLRRAEVDGLVRAAPPPITIVARAPSPGLRALAPCRIVLVDMQEGFGTMTHAAPDGEINDRVVTRFVAVGGLAIPSCERPGA